MIFLRKLLQALFFSAMIALLPSSAFSQTLIPITGITYNNKTSGRVAQVTITNLQHRSVVFSNDVGSFSINAAPTDTLLFSKPGFTEQRLVVKEQQQILVYLVPALQLEEVRVQAKTRKQEQQEVMDVYRSKGVFMMVSRLHFRSYRRRLPASMNCLVKTLAGRAGLPTK
jgi:hypothetical protein